MGLTSSTLVNSSNMSSVFILYLTVSTVYSNVYLTILVIIINIYYEYLFKFNSYFLTLFKIKIYKKIFLVKKSVCGNQQKFTPLYLVSEWNTPTGLYLLGYSTQVTSKSKNMEKVKLICTIVLLNIHECLSNHFSIRDNSFIWWIYPKSNMTYFAKKYGSLKNALIILI
jgi:hypothetical protein